MTKLHALPAEAFEESAGTAPLPPPAASPAPASPLRAILGAECRRQRPRLLLAGLLAALVAAASVTLLGLSGWFITAAALAGLGGPAVAQGFNYMLPSAAIRLLAILRTGGRYGERLVGHDAALRALARLRPALFRALAASPPATALALSTGEATARVVGDVDALEADLVRRSARWGLWASLLSGTALLLLAGTGPALAAALALGLTVAVARHLSAHLAERGREAQRAAGRLKEELATLLAAATELRAHGLEDWAAERIARRGAALGAAQQRAAAGAGWFELLQAGATGTAAVAALALAGPADLPMAALAALGAAMVVDGAAGFVRGLERQGSVAEAEARLDAILAPAGEEAPAGRVLAYPPSIRFAACAARPAVLLPPGCVAAIAGPSGCGKTTLLETLLRLREPEPGRIFLGGVDLAELDAATARRCFSLLPQDAALLAGSLRDNLLLADPEASEERLWQALHDAGLEERVSRLPGGLDGWLGENGARLSGGERRRLSLARALLRPAPWLLLDEPTEGLDAATEALVLRRLAARLAREGQGALIVTHRPAPLALCRRIIPLGIPEGVVPAGRPALPF
ncbi:ATP-binding cassette domain-containing protein [Roseomonas gilardii]|uniref:ATP-binding cassette domain-containing protein n=1 Tax=Roseomonas gilardii TaxID=257708 RepID=UPI0004B3B6B2|nr:ATP-binding cassette domain-containing protein [Roseomonas gilardii]SUE62585.1 Probable ABC transporter ATP-binding protein HI_0664 [Roseomonas gilardii subsp. rosea]